ncbi:hypothetical protein SLOPH_2340, partial [Spraguea lophii 42_110]
KTDNNKHNDKTDNKKNNKIKIKEDKENIKKLKPHKNKNNTTNEKDIIKKIKNNLSELEIKLFDEGTFKDKINTITLSIIKNNYDINIIYYLISYALEGRNENILYALSNIKDIILDNISILNNFRLRTKIIFSFRKNIKNQFISQKVAELVYEIVGSGVLVEELLPNFIDKIGNKKEYSKYIDTCVSMLCRNGISINDNKNLNEEDDNNEVIKSDNNEEVNEDEEITDKIKSNNNEEVTNNSKEDKIKNNGKKENKILFKKDIKEYIINELEESYFKSTNVRLHKNIIKLFMNIRNSRVDEIIKKIFYETKIEEESHFDILCKRALYVDDLVLTDIKKYLVFESEGFLRLLGKMKHEDFEEYLLFMINQNRFKDEEVLKVIYDYLKDNKASDKVVECLLSKGIFCEKETMIAVLLIVKNVYEEKFSYLLSPYANYFDSDVKKLAEKIMKGEQVTEFNPKDKMDMDLFSKIK